MYCGDIFKVGMCEFCCYNTTTQYLTVDKELTCGDRLIIVEILYCIICRKLFLCFFYAMSLIQGRNPSNANSMASLSDTKIASGHTRGAFIQLQSLRKN